jgi:hypothetical protein
LTGPRRAHRLVTVRLAPLLGTLAPLALAACGGADETTASAPAGGWVDVAGMTCADGSPTGIGISPGSADAVLVWLAGGNACWSEAECTASPGPFGRAQFDFLQLLVGGSLFDRTLAGNPFAAWTFVFVPYCTGDVHAGQSERSHGAAGFWRHRGYANLQAAVARVVADVARPSQVVVSGSSAGGFGALVAYDLLRARWDGAGPDPVTAALVDDSGPTFVGTAMPAALREAWWDAWNLGSTITPLCADCRNDLSAFWDVLSAAHPGDRLALLSTTEDATMRGFFDDPADPDPEMSVTAFQGALAELALELDALPDAAVFRVGPPTASDHTLFLAPWAYAAGGKPLLQWLGELVSGDPSWSSAAPP